MIVMATYTNGDWAPPCIFELEAKMLRVRAIARVEEIPQRCVKPSHFVPWFMLDVLSEVDSASVMFVNPDIELTADLVKAGLESREFDMGVAYCEKQPTSEVIYLSNQDIIRDILDAWIDQNDRHPGRHGDVNLRETLRRHRTRVRVKRLDRKLLHYRPVTCTIR